MDNAGQNIRAITNDPGYYDQLPVWMPDSIHVVYSRHLKGETMADNGPGEIYMVNTVTNELQALTFTSANEVMAIPSPTGQQFLILRDEEEGEKIYLAEWDDQLLGKPVFVAKGSDPAWRPQSKKK